METAAPVKGDVDIISPSCDKRRPYAGRRRGMSHEKDKKPAGADGFFVSVYKAGIVDKFPENKVNCTYQHGKGTSVVFAVSFLKGSRDNEFHR